MAPSRTPSPDDAATAAQPDAVAVEVVDAFTAVPGPAQAPSRVHLSRTGTGRLVTVDVVVLAAAVALAAAITLLLLSVLDPTTGSSSGSPLPLLPISGSG